VDDIQKDFRFLLAESITFILPIQAVESFGLPRLAVASYPRDG
jgi:hypothetical protein